MLLRLVTETVIPGSESPQTAASSVTLVAMETAVLTEVSNDQRAVTDTSTD